MGKRLIFFFIFCMATTEVFASAVIQFGPEETQIKGSISYSVIGKYRAEFEKFKGKIEVDESSGKIKSVYLGIEVNTIKSNCSWCDKIVKSKQLLDAQQYPEIVFESNEIIKDQNGYSIKGSLDMHGVKKEMVFPFEAEIIKDKDSGQQMLNIKGNWLINRKDFDVIWNRFLDKGGILVGNYITVDWGITSRIMTD